MILDKNREQNFLSKLSILEYKFRTIEDNKELFNIFTALHKENDEVRLHSRFISVLLSPESSHRKGDAFLIHFLKVLSIGSFKTVGVKVYPTEFNKSEYSEIDILIINRKSKQAIIIENKIYAGDSNHEDRGQLEGYFELIHEKENIPKENIFVFYLTLDGHYPSDESLGKYKVLENINGSTIDYEHHIHEWLLLCLRESVDYPFLRESISQYLNLIKKMTNNIDIKERLEIRDLISSSSENMKSAKLLMENFKHIKWHTVWDFWNELADELKSCGFFLNQIPSKENVTDTTHFDVYKKSYENSNNYGIYFNTENNIKLYIWNGTGEYWLYWGVMKESLTQAQKDKIDFFQKDKKFFFKDSANEYYKFFNLSDKENIYFPDFSYEGTFSLIDCEYRQKIIKSKLVPEIVNFVKEANL